MFTATRNSAMMLMIASMTLLLMFTVQDAVASEWRVIYHQADICAIEGSYVHIACSYTYPQSLTVKRAFWTTEESTDPPDITKDPSYSQRVQANCDWDESQGYCILKIKRVNSGDAKKYYCRITTYSYVERWLGRPGTTLSVTGLEVPRAESAKEGANVMLTCQTNCTLSGSPSFIWSKDGRPVEKKQIINNQLQLHPVSRQDEGYYTCAVKGHEHLLSSPLRFNVLYSPRKTLVYTALESTLVILTCSSDANPPVENYTWFKVDESTPVGSGQQYSITNIGSEDGGQYYCEARNEHGAENSTALALIVIRNHNTVICVAVGVAVSTCLLIMTGVLLVSYHVRTNSAKNVDYVNDSRGGNGGAINMDSVYQSQDPNTILPETIYQSLNPNTIQPDAVYQSLNPNSTKPDAVHQGLNPNTIQTDADYQNLNPNTTQEDEGYQNLSPNPTHDQT